MPKNKVTRKIQAWNETNAQEVFSRAMITKRRHCFFKKWPILCVVKTFSSNTWFGSNVSFPQHCQQQSLPPKLKLLTSMLLTGGDIEDQQSTDTQVCCYYKFSLPFIIIFHL